MRKEISRRIAQRFLEQSEGVHYEEPKEHKKHIFEVIEVTKDEFFESLGKTQAEIDEKRRHGKHKN